MKSKVYLLLVLIVTVLFTGCMTKKDATIIVKVTKLGIVQQNVPVYMFEAGLEDSLYGLKSSADKIIATDSDGIAEFGIMKVQFLIDDQATFVFVTYNDNGKINGKVAVSVRKGATKSVTIDQSIL